MDVTRAYELNLLRKELSCMCRMNNVIDATISLELVAFFEIITVV